MSRYELATLRSIIVEGGDARQIDAALEPVTALQDSNTIAPLLLMLNDESEDSAMWSLLHAAEQFDDRTYIGRFLEAVTGMVVGSSRWASIAMMRVLNSDASRAELARQVRSSPEFTRKAVVFICEAINGRDPRFLAKTVAITTAALNGS